MQVLLLLNPWPHGPLNLPILAHNLLLILRLLDSAGTVNCLAQKPLAFRRTQSFCDQAPN